MENPSDDKSLSSAPVTDRGLISYFLKLSPEERLRSNDSAIRTILELRNAFKSPPIDGNR